MLIDLAITVALGLLTQAPTPTLESPKSGRRVSVVFDSAALPGRQSYLAWLPPHFSRDTRYPVVVLLHGLGGEGADWFAADKGDLGKTLDADIASQRLPPFIVLAPNGGDGYWTDHLGKPRRRYGTFVDDVLSDARARFPIVADRAAIVGVSMGGHGAMSRALMDPTRFRAVVSIAGALFDVPPTHRQIYKDVWGFPADHDYWEATAPMAIARRLTSDQRLPGLFLSCGREDTDRFLAWNLDADRLLTQRGIPHEMVLGDGGHTWTTWRGFTRRWLDWLAPYLR